MINTPVIKKLIKTIAAFMPDPVITYLRDQKQIIDDKRNARRSARQVFTEIYRDHQWGVSEYGYCSGAGSKSKHVTDPYIEMMIDYLQSVGGDKMIVDLGCGDLEVSAILWGYCSKYVGVDIVPDLIENHKSKYSDENTEFICLDIIEDELPEGDICILRQVLQHLSNEQISKILSKLKKYDVTIITEHYPTDNPRIIPNMDMVHGSRIRVYKNSGVYLDKPPFNIDRNYLEMLLEVPGVGLSKRYDQGVIRTYKLEFK